MEKCVKCRAVGLSMCDGVWSVCVCMRVCVCVCACVRAWVFLSKCEHIKYKG